MLTEELLLFLAGSQLTSEIKRLVKKRSPLKLAVAYWGSGGLKLLDLNPKRKDLIVVCCLKGGKSDPDLIKKFGKRAKHSDQLHAKIVWTPTAAIISSANASSNGLPEEEQEIREAGLIEAGLLVTDPMQLKVIGRWIDQLHKKSKFVKKSDLDSAREARNKRLWGNSSRRTKKQSLIEALAEGGKLEFDKQRIFFLFCKVSATSRELNAAKKSVRDNKKTKSFDHARQCVPSATSYDLEPLRANVNNVLRRERSLTRPPIRREKPLLRNAVVETSGMACRDEGRALQPIVPEQDRRCFRVMVGGGHRQVRQLGFAAIHAERGLRVRGRLRGPPAQPHIAAGGALLVLERAVSRKPCLGTLQQDLGGIIGLGAFARRGAKPGLGEPVTRIEMGAKNFLGLPIPAGVDHAQSRDLQPDRKGFEPLQRLCMGTGPLADLAQEFPVLLKILLGMGAQEAAVFIGLRPAQGIEFVIVHDGKGGARLAHAHGDVENVPLLRAAIDEVADEDDATIGMMEGAVVFAVVQFLQQAPEDGGMAVDVADDVEVGFGHAWGAFGFCGFESAQCLKGLDCFVARAPRNDVESFPPSYHRHCERTRSNPVQRGKTGLLPPSLFELSPSLCELRRTRSADAVVARAPRNDELSGSAQHKALNS
jgi:hypothetical protein